MAQPDENRELEEALEPMRHPPKMKKSQIISKRPKVGPDGLCESSCTYGAISPT